MSGFLLILLSMGRFPYIFLISCLLNNIKETGVAFVKKKIAKAKIIGLIILVRL